VNRDLGVPAIEMPEDDLAARGASLGGSREGAS
jgi:hypothetical protein